MKAIEELKEEFRKLYDQASPEVREIMKETFNGCEITEAERRAKEKAQRDADMAYANAHRPPYPSSPTAAEKVHGITVVKNDQRLSDHVRDGSLAGICANELDFGRAIKGMVTGDWSGAEAERLSISKTMSGGDDSAGGYLLPSPLSTRLIDLARNNSVCFKAGAITIPMTSGTLDIARLTSDPSAYWKPENAAGTPSDIGTGRYTLRAKTLMALVKTSVELIEDAANAGAVIQNAISNALSLELDRAALRGNGVGQEPLGIRGWSPLGASYGVQHRGSIGVPMYDDFSAAAEDILSANGPDSGLSVIYSPRTWGTIDRFKDGEGLTLIPPPSFAAMKRLVTNQIPENLGVGGNESEAYVGDFSQLAIGMRTQMVLEVSRAASDSSSSAFRNLQVWIRAYLRADVVLLQPTWFVVLDGITA
ncbi:MAG: phage major capsid protein [Acidobacteriota bacterium]|nr:phage major capsid protein [Acidobacteriota bacterium]